MTHESRQLALMRDVLRFVPDEHQREAGDALLKLMANVKREAEKRYQIAIERTSE